MFLPIWQNSLDFTPRIGDNAGKEMAKTAVLKKEIVEPITEPSGATGLYLISALVKNDEALEKVASFIKESGAEVKKAENLGIKSLVFPINKNHQLTLVSVFFTAESKTANKLQETLRHEEFIERFLLTTWRGPIELPPRKNARVKKEERTEVEQ